MSDTAVTAALIPGEPIRLGDEETTFTGLWAGGDAYIQIDPFITAPVGAMLWWKR